MLIFVKLKSLSLNSRLSVSVDLISLMNARSLIDVYPYQLVQR